MKTTKRHALNIVMLSMLASISQLQKISAADTKGAPLAMAVGVSIHDPETVKVFAEMKRLQQATGPSLGEVVARHVAKTMAPVVQNLHTRISKLEHQAGRHTPVSGTPAMRGLRGPHRRKIPGRPAPQRFVQERKILKKEQELLDKMMSQQEATAE